MKPIYLTALFLLCCFGCKKKNTQPTEYFSFDADGVHHEYPQIIKEDLFGGIKTLSAFPTSATVGYQISAYSVKNPTARSMFTFSFEENKIPTKDTILFNNDDAYASILDFGTSNNNYYTNNIRTGRIIFTIKNSKRLEGTFEFVAQQHNDSSLIYINNGKFSIIPEQ